MNVFCEMVKKTLKSNEIFHILLFVHEPSTSKHEHVRHGKDKLRSQFNRLVQLGVVDLGDVVDH